MESNTTILPQECSSKLLNHLGLVAGMYDELGLGELIDSLIPQGKEKRVVSIGQAVKAMVLRNSRKDMVDWLHPHWNLENEIVATCFMP